MSTTELTPAARKADICRRAAEYAGASWDDRDRTGTLADQLRAVYADTLPKGTDGDLDEWERMQLLAMADEAGRHGL